MIETLINRFEALKGNRKSSEIKALSCILYHFGLSYRKVAKALERFERFSHLWEAIDMETREVIAVHVSYGRMH